VPSVTRPIVALATIPSAVRSRLIGRDWLDKNSRSSALVIRS